MMKPNAYEYFYCPGCSKYKHRRLEHLVVVAHLTEQRKRQDNPNTLYTQHYTLLCTGCITKAKEVRDNGKGTH